VLYCEPVKKSKTRKELRGTKWIKLKRAIKDHRT
jgi:hypothetical protein